VPLSKQYADYANFSKLSYIMCYKRTSIAHTILLFMILQQVKIRPQKRNAWWENENPDDEYLWPLPYQQPVTTWKSSQLQTRVQATVHVTIIHKHIQQNGLSRITHPEKHKVCSQR